ncbi:hypothetical protein KM043_007872 [Ampulex compressa]|nr:hypothetical protein KM043_007872 [Ampulex compressa]
MSPVAKGLIEIMDDSVRKAVFLVAVARSKHPRPLVAAAVVLELTARRWLSELLAILESARLFEMNVWRANFASVHCKSASPRPNGLSSPRRASKKKAIRLLRESPKKVLLSPKLAANSKVSPARRWGEPRVIFRRGAFGRSRT